ncbi:MAG: type II asparaginase [Proteobacteria bacterium]|nr:type II asparaginase [Pseudomonadota bacterium]
MKTSKILFFAFCFMCCANVEAKNIVVLATGGTIAGEGESAVGSKYEPGKVGIDQVIKNIPGITKLAEIKAEQVMQIASQDMTSESWLKIAKRVNEVLSQNSVDGVVITHGTDTLEETAYFLNLVVKSKKPVVLVGAMRPTTSLSADGALNLYNAVALAASKNSYNQGVLVMFNDEIYAARDVTKTNTTNVSSFAAPNAGMIGSVIYGKVKFYYESIRAHTDETIFNVKKSDSLPKVEIVYAYSGMDSGVIDYLVESGVKGIVLAGVGDGNINKQGVEKLTKAAKNGVLIVRSAHLGSGLVEPNVEIEDDEFGFVTADNLSPKKARILAMLALTKTCDVGKVREMFAKY